MTGENNDKERAAYEADKRLISILRSGNLKAILSAIEEIRKDGRTSILPEIFEVLLVTEADEVIRSCTDLLSDLKSKEAVPILISSLKEKKYRSIRNLILAACWQNGLDYHMEVQLFARILLEDDYLSSLEAFTLIENSLSLLEDKEIIELTLRLKEGLKNAEPQKQPLIKELIATIKSY